MLRTAKISSSRALKALLRDRDLAAPCVEIEFRAPRAIFMILSP